jgi:23S rRNA (cytidine1920-2'-O)/16S rRNA (cytidine1409-2'-O)-methyltransferase
MKRRLDLELVARNLVTTRSQAESYIKLGKVTVNGEIASKPGRAVQDHDDIKVLMDEQYVSRAGLKLASIADKLNLDFRDKTVLDVGSSTGGFTDFALRHGASRVIAVDSGTNQLHPKLRPDPRIELHEQTDIRVLKQLSRPADYVLIDVSFISIREVLKHLPAIIDSSAEVIAMVKPQFETGLGSQKTKGVVKNEALRRKILADFEQWARSKYLVKDKADSLVRGEKGNRERFYKLALLK